MKIKFIVFSIVFSLIAILSSSSNATVYRDAVIDSHENFVRSSFGDCVRTSFQTSGDPCAQVIRVKADAITKIMAMDERIVYFDFDKYQLKPESKEKLRVLAGVFKKHNISAVKIIGYADRIGTDEYNYTLSEKRANAVKDYLDSLVKLDSSIVELRGLGKIDLVQECQSIHKRSNLISCLAPNRRVEIEIDYYDYVN